MHGGLTHPRGLNAYSSSTVRPYHPYRGSHITHCKEENLHRMNDLNGLLESALDESQRESTTQTKVEKPQLSKSERVRLYLKQHPGVRNKDVVAALSHHGVKAADVANVKAQLKRKAEKNKGKSEPAAAKSAPVAAETAAPADSSNSIDATVGLDVLELGMEFIRKSGGVNEAQHVLNLIRRIRQI
ncbi:hypothetical protein Pan14r_07110 [Crateriforma conspicua]|uniref:Uncharacterized protein n=2 Tax=Crateriforma conspicua TaxID=2527996 RepID=A0A5C5XYG8_9PLAN|nr:hypothetical protein Mal65_19060 [Crateriforma conspicua]TWT68466.1 hypothetical protein Pan14r_07110 [Crateriforma conspicua]